MFSSFFFYDDADPRELHVLTHSFPTRRASDLKGDPRPLQAAGAYWEYNDVRINQLALALLHLFQQPLPDVFREAIMRPVGATENWQWVGYDNAWVQINGQRMQSVTGGTHWGGGMSVSAHDQAKVGQMLLDRGMAQGTRETGRAKCRERVGQYV